jgi:YgiT-type zinc finger domain-containing protein
MHDHHIPETCYFCGNTAFTQQEIEQTFHIQGKYYLVRGIPARVCANCGESIFLPEVGEKIRVMLHAPEEAQQQTLIMEQYEYANYG